MKSLPLIIGTAWVAFFVGDAFDSIGRTFPVTTVDGWLPVLMAFMLLVPLLAGYYAGKNNR